MNTFVSTAAVASASALAAPANSAQIAIDDRATLARVVEIVDLLRTRYVCEGWENDDEGAERALAYFLRRADGPPFKDEDEDTAAYYQALEFFSSHGQNLDWIHDGNPGGMICGPARSSRRASALAAQSESADPILSLIDNHKRANAEYSEATKDLVPGTCSPDPAEKELYGDREADARHDLATTTPTTLAGLLAVLKYVEGVGEGEFSSSGRSDNAFDEDLKMILISAQDCLDAHLNPAGSVAA
jgi:hypothetical protein